MEVYTSKPHDFEQEDPSVVYWLHKALYGLKKSPKVWYEKLTQTLVNFDFTHSKCDHSLFVYSYQGITLYVLVCVDDNLITDSCSTLVHKLIDSLHATFSLNKLGSPEYFLGI